MMWFGLGPYAYHYTTRNVTSGTAIGNTPEPVSTASAKKVRSAKVRMNPATVHVGHKLLL